MHLNAQFCLRLGERWAKVEGGVGQQNASLCNVYLKLIWFGEKIKSLLLSIEVGLVSTEMPIPRCS